MLGIGTVGIYGKIESCYFTGEIIENYTGAGGTVGIGGIVGYNYKGYIKNCYNIGKITTNRKTNVGEIVGTSSDVSNCFYREDSAINGNGEPISSDRMKQIDFISQLNGENGESFVYDENNINNGYPILYWQKEDTPIVTKSVLKEIKIENPPLKTEYTEGEKFDKTGMVVVAIYSDGTSKEITSYTISPQEELKKENEYITISYIEDGVTKTTQQKINVKEKTENTLKEIKIENPPLKTEYTEGEKFDKTGMVVVAIYSDGIAKEITSYTISPQEELKKENEYITISYTEGEETKSVMQKITVNGIKQNQKDNTISSNVLPDTGKLLGIVLIIALVAVVVVLNYINTKRYKDI